MKKKHIFKIFLFLVIFIINMNICYADIYKAKITGNGVRIRSGAGTNYNSLKDVSIGSEYNLVSTEIVPTEEGCSNGWYNIYYSGVAKGYICSDFVEVAKYVINDNPTNECEENLKNLNFPSSYWPKICELKVTHPNWIFTPVFTGLDFEEAVNKESACGKSYIASSDAANIDSSCKNEYTKTWYPASNSAVAHYMDPRNWISEQYIFQFEKLSYNTLLNEVYVTAANYSIRNAAFYKYHSNLGNDLGTVINEVGKDTNVSPVFLASRMLQELGSKESLYNLYSGIYNSNDGVYVGYYNFYNIGVSDKCATTEGTTICGLRYAYNNGWNSLYNAIKGGATQIYNNYIDAGQYSDYFQKFNLVPKNKNSLYLHQYMTNIAAPSSESKTTYNAYKSQGILDNAFEFYIPIFDNIDSSIVNINNGIINDTSLSDTLEEEITIDIDTIITSSGFKKNGDNISGISPNSSVSSVKSAIESISGSNSVIIKNRDGNAVIDGNIGTGFKIEISNANDKKEVNVIIKGDTSGDGIINALDLLQVQKSILGTYNLNNSDQLAADTSKDGTVNALDLLQVQKSILGTYTIEQ